MHKSTPAAAELYLFCSDHLVSASGAMPQNAFASHIRVYVDTGQKAAKRYRLFPLKKKRGARCITKHSYASGKVRQDKQRTMIARQLSILQMSDLAEGGAELHRYLPFTEYANEYAALVLAP